MVWCVGEDYKWKYMGSWQLPQLWQNQSRLFYATNIHSQASGWSFEYAICASAVMIWFIVRKANEWLLATCHLSPKSICLQIKDNKQQIIVIKIVNKHKMMMNHRNANTLKGNHKPKIKSSKILLPNKWSHLILINLHSVTITNNHYT